MPVCCAPMFLDSGEHRWSLVWVHLLTCAVFAEVYPARACPESCLPASGTSPGCNPCKFIGPLLFTHGTSNLKFLEWIDQVQWNAENVSAVHRLLQNNAISGSIPDRKLNHNSLSGALPDSLAAINGLALVYALKSFLFFLTLMVL